MTKKGLDVTVNEGDYDGLVGVMHHLIAVKDRQANTDAMFEPLKQMIELLKTYNQEMSDDVHQQLEVWISVKEGEWNMIELPYCLLSPHRSSQSYGVLLRRLQ